MLMFGLRRPGFVYAQDVPICPAARPRNCVSPASAKRANARVDAVSWSLPTGRRPECAMPKEGPRQLAEITAAWQQAQQAFEQSERRYTNLVEHSLGLICTHDL